MRRARESDRDTVLSFATHTWDGWDYIPHAWPVWLAAKDGVVLVATNPDGRPIAITRIAMVSPTEAWLEGIRVDPDVRGMEVATDLQVAELQWAAAQGADVIRYATGANNEGSHKLGARHGIELLLAFRNYWWSPNPDDDADDPSAFDPEVRAASTALRGEVLDGLASEGRIASMADARRLWALVDLAPDFVAALRLYEPRPWAIGELTAERFARHVERREVISFDDRAIAILLREQLAGEDSSLRLAMLMGDVAPVIELVERIRAIAGKTVRFRLSGGGPLQTDGHDQLLAAGYRSPDWTLHLLGRPIDRAHPIPEVDPARVVLAEKPAPIIAPMTF
ncbi:MAG TPA: GNAT family N-acetyltransferase [Candidatus Limnocylindria bacterium]|nr:GNAT family N-acetyltransferase [Candidatus Limnocylindria bacterium]